MAPKTICLVSIVKNEGKIITRMLESAIKICDYVCITDTGSTDNTISVMKNYLKKEKVKHEICKSEFKGFGKSRSESIVNAKTKFPEADYLLMLDADMILVIKDTFDKESLKDSHYLVMQKSATTEYYNIRLLESKYNWGCARRTHEYYDIIDKDKFSLSSSKLGTLMIDDREDGGCKHDKYERDYKLLKLDLKELNDERTLFYLGQTCVSLDKDHEGIGYYKKRSEAGGFEEEAWMSLVRIGDTYLKLEKEDDAIIYYLKAFRRRPWRAEAPCKLSELFAKLKDNYSAYSYALAAKSIPYPKEDVLFIDTASHTYAPDFHMNVAAYYIGKYEEGLTSGIRFLSLDAPEYLKNLVLHNLKFYYEHYGLKEGELTYVKS